MPNNFYKEFRDYFKKEDMQASIAASSQQPNDAVKAEPQEEDKPDHSPTKIPDWLYKGKFFQDEIEDPKKLALMRRCGNYCTINIRLQILNKTASKHRNEAVSVLRCLTSVLDSQTPSSQ